MQRNVSILAASYIGPTGHGNHLTGIRPWPSGLDEAFKRGVLTDLHWSLLFSGDASRFARMDLMSRMGYMAAELLDVNFESLDPELRERTGVCVETAAGSLATDVRFLQTPRPSLFSYTLPSTVIGELCIRYRLKGPVLCLMSSGSSNAVAEAAEWIRKGDAEACLCVNCEAVDQDLREALPFANAEFSGWHSCAVFLGEGQGGLREQPFLPGSMVELCRSLCRVG